jgi:hypothetical protein
MTTIVGISGSLRAASFNTALLRAAAAEMPSGATLEIGSIKGIPLYDADVETSQGLPPPVVALKGAIMAADGLLLVTPEYNNSIPGVFKNAIDWLSRPTADIARVFGRRPIALIGASPGGFGTRYPDGLVTRAGALGTNPGSAGDCRSRGPATCSMRRARSSTRAVRTAAFLAGFCAFVAPGGAVIRRGLPYL